MYVQAESEDQENKKWRRVETVFNSKPLYRKKHEEKSEKKKARLKEEMNKTWGLNVCKIE